MEQLPLGIAAPPTARQRRYLAGDRAVARAQRQVSRVWLEEARQAIRIYGHQHPDGWLFEDARQWAEREGVARQPPDPRAWGGVNRQLQARGDIAQVGVARSKVNACLKPTWRIVRAVERSLA